MTNREASLEDSAMIDCAEPVKPFLKWAGGKQWLAPMAPKIVPAGFKGTYFEPFLGGGAFFFAARPEKAVLADLNLPLVTTYGAVKADVEQVISVLRGYPHDEQFFNRIRRSKPRVPHRVAARLIYLNKTAFNGLYRENLRGEFNVPFGKFSNPGICQPERLRAAAKALQGVRLLCGDFEGVVAAAKEGDFVYFDPPYITGHQNNGFMKYNANLFAWPDQSRLAVTAKALHERGVIVVVSNADHPSISRLYKGFHRYSRGRHSLIAGSSLFRSDAGEALFASIRLDALEEVPEWQ
jgi:DNA adenine methylase